jgi:Ca2+-binding EF-hand superfamily protein
MSGSNSAASWVGRALGGWFALAALAASAAAPAPGEAAGDAQDLLFLGGGPPIRVRLRVEIGGQPLAAAWRAGVGKLHAYLDADGNGTVSRQEAERVELPRLLGLFAGDATMPRPAPTMRNAPGPALPALDSRPHDGVVSVEELAEYLRALRGPLAVRARPPSEEEQDTTFRRIDVNGDHGLSADERANAAQLLQKFDQNDDESLSIAELAAFRNPRFGFGRNQERGAGEPPVVLLDPGGSRIRMVQQLLNRLDTGAGEGAKAKDHRLSRTEIGLGAETFSALDNDGDATLDGDELMQFLEQLEPAVELIVRLGPRPIKRSVVEFIDRTLADNGKPGLGSVLKPYDLELIEPRPPVAAGSLRVQMRTRPGDEALLTLERDDICVEIRTEDRKVQSAQARSIYTSLFRNRDADKSGSLSRSEASGQEPFESLFSLMDRNGDDQVRTEELSAVLSLLEEVEGSQAMLEIVDRGTLLFANLDVDGDGHLGLRELRLAGARLAPFDRNGDGLVTAAEIPHRFEWSLAQASIPLTFIFNYAGVQRRMPGRVAAAAPAWFTQMDRNHDGDLSPREFLGPRSEFLRLDANGDGLIEAGEAK